MVTKIGRPQSAAVLNMSSYRPDVSADSSTFSNQRNPERTPVRGIAHEANLAVQLRVAAIEEPEKVGKAVRMCEGSEFRCGCDPAAYVSSTTGIVIGRQCSAALATQNSSIRPLDSKRIHRRKHLIMPLGRDVPDCRRCPYVQSAVPPAIHIERLAGDEPAGTGGEEKYRSGEIVRECIERERLARAQPLDHLG